MPAYSHWTEKAFSHTKKARELITSLAQGGLAILDFKPLTMSVGFFTMFSFIRI